MRDGKFVNDWATMKLHHYKNMIKECIRELPASQARQRGASASGSDSQQVAGSKVLSASAQLRGLAAVFQAGTFFCLHCVISLLLERGRVQAHKGQLQAPPATGMGTDLLHF